MIAQINGQVIEKHDSSLIIEAGGIGYQVLVSEVDYEQISLDETIKLYTHFHVRENSQELFGFASLSAKNLFEILIGVNGVGPKMGLNLMSLGDEHQIRQAISSENIAYISGATGVGKKLAERVCVELKDKVGVLAGETADNTSSNDAIEALVALGYSRNQAAKALVGQDVDLSIEQQVKQALKDLAS